MLRRRSGFLYLLTLLSLATAPFAAADCVDYSAHMHRVGLWEGNTTPHMLCYHNGYCYFDQNYYRIAWVDVGNPENPVDNGFFLYLGAFYDIAASGDYLFIAAASAGVKVLDISDPEAPVPVDTVPMTGSVTRIAVAGNYAYAVAGSGGLHILDISDPLDILLLSTVTGPASSTRDVALEGNFAYVAWYTDDLQVVDVSDPADPFICGSVDLPAPAIQIAVGGGCAYTTYESYDNGMQIVDVSDPCDPTFLVSFPTRWALDVHYDDGIAFVPDRYWGLTAVDVSDPDEPVLLGAVTTDGSGSSGVVSIADVEIVGDYAFVANSYGSANLDVFDISPPTSVFPLGGLDTMNALEVLISGDDLLVADGYDGLRVIDVSDPTDPGSVRRIDTTGFATGLACAGSLVCMADYGSDLAIIDLAEPDESALIAELDLPGYSYYVKLAGGHAYVAGYTQGLQVVDVSDPRNPAVVDSLDLGSTFGVSIVGDMAYVANFLCIHAVSIADPGSVEILGSFCFTNGGITCIEARDDRVYAGYSGDLMIFDVSDPADIMSLSRTILPDSISGIALDGNTAYVACSHAGVWVVDVTNPAAPVVRGNVESYYANEVCCDGDYIYIADDLEGIRIAPAHCGTGSAAPPPAASSALRLSANYPNPFNPATAIRFELDSRSRVLVTVHDASGRRVACLADRIFDGGIHQLSWDGRDDSGRRLASGAYFLRAEAEGELARAKLTLIK